MNRYSPEWYEREDERELDHLSLSTRIRDAFRFEDGEPCEWRDVAVFLTGTAWGGMIVFGVLCAIAARHAP